MSATGSTPTSGSSSPVMARGRATSLPLSISASSAVSLHDSSGSQAEFARGRLRRLRTLASEERALAGRIGARVGGHPLLTLPGAGAIITATLVGEVGDVRRFSIRRRLCRPGRRRTHPKASSGQTQRMRLNRGGNRRLNRALYTIALSQAFHHPPAKATSPGNGPRARPGGRPSVPSSASSFAPSSGCSRPVPHGSNSRLDNIGAWFGGLRVRERRVRGRQSLLAGTCALVRVVPGDTCYLTVACFSRSTCYR